VNWTEAADRLLTDLWEKGLTMGGVAEAMTAAGHPVESRSAISGRMNRLRKRGVVFSEREPYRFTAKEPKPPKPKVTKPKRLITHDNGVDYLSNHDGCKAVLDTRSGRYNLRKCCGKSREAGTPYCSGHLSAYQNPGARKPHG
jgi:hypothetical protein